MSFERCWLDPASFDLRLPSSTFGKERVKYQLNRLAYEATSLSANMNELVDEWTRDSVVTHATSYQGVVRDSLSGRESELHSHHPCCRVRFSAIHDEDPGFYPA